MISDTNLLEALEALGALLQHRELSYDVAIVGGGALLLRGLISRPTKDIDAVAAVHDGEWCIAEPMPPSVIEAVKDVARAFGLAPDWLNPGPTSLLTLGLPLGFADRATVREFSALTLRIASKQDLVMLKVYAAADHWPDLGKHFQDLLKLKPSAEALLESAAWCQTHDPSIGFADYQLAPTWAALREALGHA